MNSSVKLKTTKKTRFFLPGSTLPIDMILIECVTHYLLILTQYEDIGSLIRVSSVSSSHTGCSWEESLGSETAHSFDTLNENNDSNDTSDINIHHHRLQVNTLLGDRDDEVMDVFAKQIYLHLIRYMIIRMNPTNLCDSSTIPSVLASSTLSSSMENSGGLTSSVKPLLIGFGIKEPVARSREALLLILDTLKGMIRIW